VNRVLKLFRPNNKLSEFNTLSLKIVYGFAATLRLTLDKEATTTSKSYKDNKIKPQGKSH